MRPVLLTYGSETLVSWKCDEAVLGVFERKFLRVIFGPTNDNGEWRIKYNNELYTVYRGSDIVTYSKLSAPELFFFLSLAHSVYKIWIIQEPNTLELWNKLHF